MRHETQQEAVIILPLDGIDFHSRPHCASMEREQEIRGLRLFLFPFSAPGRLARSHRVCVILSFGAHCAPGVKASPLSASARTRISSPDLYLGAVKTQEPNLQGTTRRFAPFRLATVCSLLTFNISIKSSPLAGVRRPNVYLRDLTGVCVWNGYCTVAFTFIGCGRRTKVFPLQMTGKLKLGLLHICVPLF